MAKSKKKNKPTGPDALGEGIERFKDGDYPAARKLLAEKAKDPDLNDADRRRADDLIDATKLDRGTLLTALACLAFFGIAILVGLAAQP